MRTFIRLFLVGTLLVTGQDISSAAPERAHRSAAAPASTTCTTVATHAVPRTNRVAQAPLRPLADTKQAANGPYEAPDTPLRLIPGDEYRVKVTVRNTTANVLPKATYALSYHWTLPDGTDLTGPGNRLETDLPGDLAPGAMVTLDAELKAPPNADVGNKREAWVLKWDLLNRQTRKWLSESGVPTLDQAVTVEHPTSDQLGLEKFYQYSGKATGSGSGITVNQFSGNAVFAYNAFSNPSRGLATFARIGYNSADTSNSYAGQGWSVATSTLQRLGTPLQFDGLLTPILTGHPTKVTLVDGDGTSHEFELDKHDSNDTRKWTYASPAGVHLLLQKLDDGWVFTSPDRTKMYFDDRGYQTRTVEKNGNELKFHYQNGFIGNRSVKLLTHITDATDRRTLSLDYYQRGDDFSFFEDNKKITAKNLTNTAIVNQLRSITDITGRKVTFAYGEDGLLQEIVDGAGTPDEKPFTFFYEDAHRTSNTKLARITDPNGASTKLNYDEKWRVGQITDRIEATTSFTYTDPDGDQGSKIASKVTDGNGHATDYLLDGYGRAEKLTNAKAETTELTWDADNNVIKLREHNGATTTWRFDEKTGFPLEIKDPEANANGWPGTRMGYRTDLDGYVADLTEKTSPEGRKWAFVYDDKGNLVAVTDPKGTKTPEEGDYTARYVYDDFGHLTKTTDANGHSTVYADYDANGYPQRITDPLNCSSFFRYDDAGNVVSTMDAKQKIRTFTFDVFKRPLSTRIPKDAAAEQYIFTAGATYDRNDNIVKLTAANGAVTTTGFDEMDRQVSVTSPRDDGDNAPVKTTTFTYDKVGNLIRHTMPKGNLTPGDPNDHTSTFVYDEIDQLTVATDALGQRTTAEYDGVGNLVKKVDPKRNATPDPNDYTAKFVFDLNHRLVKGIDAAGNDVETRYDRDGNVVETLDEDDNVSTTVFDERSMPIETREPHERQQNGEITYFTTKIEYDQVGNETRVTTPRGVQTADDPNDFVREMRYDELNRLKEEVLPFDSDDEQVKEPDRIFHSYDEVGNLKELSAPPSDKQSVRNVTKYTYFDNGWTRSSTDSWGVRTEYDYNAIGEQTKRTIISAGGGSSRTQTWDYHPDGKRKLRTDGGVPVGKHVALIDNSDTPTEVTGNWGTESGPGDYEGFDYRTHGPGSGDSFTWKADIPANGRYEVFTRYAAATATDAAYTVEHNGGVATRTVDQTQNAGKWISLGTYEFTEDNLRKVTLSANANGSVTADAVRFVRDNSGEPDQEEKRFEYAYDAHDNQTSVIDRSSGRKIDEYAVTYDVLNRADRVEERKDGKAVNTTTFGYDPNGNVLDWKHDDQSAVYEYDARDLVAKVTNRKTGSDPEEKVTTFAYTKRAHLEKQVKHNGNTVEFSYFLDGLPKHQVEKKKNSNDVVNEHTLAYDHNGNRTKDDARTQNADNKGELRSTNSTYTYDPRDRVRKVEKTGADKGTETYRHDANNNVIEQKFDDTPATFFTYDRNRLTSAKTDAVTSNYSYDVFGRLSKVSANGEQREKYVYDGFDHTVEHRAGSGPATRTTKYVHDPLDRTVSQSSTGGGGEAKTTEMLYLGLSEQVLTERENGKVSKTYQYSPHGELLSQVVVKDDGTEEDAFFGFGPHSDVENVTDSSGDNKATYGYTAYGSNKDSAFTGADKPGGEDQRPYNSYRFNSKRFDSASGNYDMGFRDYSPSQNRFLSLDLYNGALHDLALAANPFTMNRYAFGGGNPISAVEIDGHLFGLSFSDIGHAVLDVAGLIPVVGEVADLANAAWYAAEGNYVDAALSAASAIPFAGYAATAVKAGKYADKAIDAVQTVDHVGDAANTARKVADDVPTPPKVDAPQPKPDANAPAKPKDQPDCNSFIAGTPVLMADGSRKPIEQVQKHDLVVSTDSVTGTTASQPVAELIPGNGERVLVEITIDAGAVVATDNHKFWLEAEQRWALAKDLVAGQWLRTSSGDLVLIESTRTWREHLKVYNFEVSAFHTYYVGVGNLELLVHNDSCSTNARKLGKNLEKAGETRPSSDWQAHHIVPSGAKKAKPAQKVLEKFGVDINDARNGIFLPRNKSIPNPNGVGTHNNTFRKVYYQEINRELSKARSADDVFDILATIKNRLTAGDWP